MVGDIRGAWLANYRTLDRSVKGNALTKTEAVLGNITQTLVATDAELMAYGGFSANDYLSQAYDADFDFGTGDFSVMFWVKSAATGSYEAYVSRVNGPSEAGDWFLVKNSNETLDWYRHSGSSWVVIKTSTGTIGTSWTQATVVRRGGVFNFYINGEFDSSVSDTNSYTPSTGPALMIGERADTSQPATNASLSLLRISATAPTPQQIKEIYEAEKPLFAEDAKCLLAANQVNDLAYDKTSGLLHVASESTASSKSFRGLEAVESLTSDGSLGLTAATEVDGITAAGGVIAAYDNAKAGVNLPSIDVRAELNEGESKIPDDGKLHFSGVTDNTATPLIIGHIPVAEGESVAVRAKIIGQVYQDQDGARITVNYERSFYRDIGGNIIGRGDTYILRDEVNVLTDAILTYEASSPPPHNIYVKVTGLSSKRMVWKASVEVQRISDKLYER
jgi:hypothetical protein